VINLNLDIVPVRRISATPTATGSACNRDPEDQSILCFPVGFEDSTSDSTSRTNN